MLAILLRLPWRKGRDDRVNESQLNEILVFNFFENDAQRFYSGEICISKRIRQKL